jgi:hypothetical protein
VFFKTLELCCGVNFEFGTTAYTAKVSGSKLMEKVSSLFKLCVVWEGLAVAVPKKREDTNEKCCWVLDLAKEKLGSQNDLNAAEDWPTRLVGDKDGSVTNHLKNNQKDINVYRRENKSNHHAVLAAKANGAEANPEGGGGMEGSPGLGNGDGRIAVNEDKVEKSMGLRSTKCWSSGRKLQSVMGAPQRFSTGGIRASRQARDGG